MNVKYLENQPIADSFDISIDIKIQFFRVWVTIEPRRSFVTTNCVMYHNRSINLELMNFTCFKSA